MTLPETQMVYNDNAFWIVVVIKKQLSCTLYWSFLFLYIYIVSGYYQRGIYEKSILINYAVFKTKKKKNQINNQHYVLYEHSFDIF